MSHGILSRRPRRSLKSGGVLGITLFGLVAAGSYNEKEALLSAYLATAAYCGYPKTNASALERWDCGPPCDAVPGVSSVRQVVPPPGYDAYAFVGKFRRECILVFRGTSNLHGWLKDLEAYRLVQLAKYGINCTFNSTPCKVGDGFLATYLSIAGYVRGNLSDIGCRPRARLRVIGHSLGAAEAVLAMYDLAGQGYKIQQSYTFGQPRVGDFAFAAAFDRDIGAKTNYRVTYHRDPVVHLPWRGSGLNGQFKHISTEVFYNGTMAQGHRLCDGSGEDPLCAGQYSDSMRMILSCVHMKTCDHLHYMTAAKSSDMDGALCRSGGAMAELLI